MLLIPCFCLADNWAVILNSSKFYFNYRHTTNALMIYQILKRMGFSDDRIILMLPENIPCNPRNNFPYEMFNGQTKENLYDGNIEVDYRGKDITPDSIVRLLTGRYDQNTPPNQRLNSNKNSRIFMFFNGHGGDSYLKIQDTQVLRDVDIALALKEMHIKERYAEIFFILETCQAFSLFRYIDVPNVHGLATSLVGQMAKSLWVDTDLGISMTDHFSYYFADLLKNISYSDIQKLRLSEVMQRLPGKLLKADLGYQSSKPASSIILGDFMTDMQSYIPAPKLNLVIQKRERKLV
jgi:phosphatidylinositol glycan class K